MSADIGETKIKKGAGLAMTNYILFSLLDEVYVCNNF